MSLNIQLDKLKKEIIDSFKEQFNFQSNVNDWNLVFNRLLPGEILSLSLTTKNTSDNVRILFKVLEPSNATKIGSFHLQVKPNFRPGNLLNEVFVTYGTVASSDYPEIYNYLNSEEFKNYQNTKPRLLTQTGKVLCYQNSYPLETQR